MSFTNALIDAMNWKLSEEDTLKIQVKVSVKYNRYTHHGNEKNCGNNLLRISFSLAFS